MNEFLTTFAQADELHSAQDVTAALDRMAEDISATLKDSNPLVLCVMVGGLITAGQLLTRLSFPLQVDYVHATRYRGDTQGGQLQWRAAPSVPMQDRVVLLIDDIFDEGWTLEAIVNSCIAAGAKEVHSAVLVEKHHNRKAEIRPTFVGLHVEDRYVFGYGMDYKEYGRNLAGIYAVKM